MFGAEYAIRINNKDRYAKAQAARKQGISYDTYFKLLYDLEINNMNQEEFLQALESVNLTGAQKRSPVQDTISELG